MLRPFIQRRRRDARPRERGVTMAIVAVSMFAVIAMAGLSIDIGTLYQASDEAQRAADAGALAAARTISMTGLTTDPQNATSTWQAVCGGTTSPASLAAITAAQQNQVGGATLPTTGITVYYSAGSSAPSNVTDCSTLAGTSFGVNPVVTVTVTQSGLPTFFSRIWGRTGSTVGATASAEAFNPSGSEVASGSDVIPVQPRCVKPWIVPNKNPLLPAGCTNATCDKFVNLDDGSIVDPGLNSGTPAGVIGEQFDIQTDCSAAGRCNNGGSYTPSPGVLAGPPISLQYVPASAPASSAGVPSCAAANTYQQAIGGCDETTAYQCGVQASTDPNPPNVVDLNENPGAPTNDTSDAAQCLIHQVAGGQDSMPTVGTFPFPITAGSGNPLNVPAGSQITSSSSIVSLPIYDNTAGPLTPNGANQVPVTIVGFLQVFINQVNPIVQGNLSVTVLNVAGCGNGTGTTVATTPITGTSPVPVRLITPQ